MGGASPVVELAVRPTIAFGPYRAHPTCTSRCRTASHGGKPRPHWQLSIGDRQFRSDALLPTACLTGGPRCPTSTSRCRTASHGESHNLNPQFQLGGPIPSSPPLLLLLGPARGCTVLQGSPILLPVRILSIGGLMSPRTSGIPPARLHQCCCLPIKPPFLWFTPRPLHLHIRLHLSLPGVLESTPACDCGGFS